MSEVYNPGYLSVSQLLESRRPRNVAAGQVSEVSNPACLSRSASVLVFTYLEVRGQWRRGSTKSVAHYGGSYNNNNLTEH
eukprot:scaffold87029_cov26-Tisochrysis_lutea.AAC.1